MGYKITEPGRLGKGLTAVHISASEVSTYPVPLNSQELLAPAGLKYQLRKLMVWFFVLFFFFVCVDIVLLNIFPHLSFSLHVPFIRNRASSSGLVVLLLKVLFYLNCLALFCSYGILALGRKEVTRYTLQLCKIPQWSNVTLRDPWLFPRNSAHQVVCSWNTQLVPATQGTKCRRGRRVCGIGLQQQVQQ